MILYHTIANAVIAVEVYFITGLYKNKMKAYFRTGINLMLTVGYLTALISGLGFAYFGHNWNPTRVVHRW